MTKDEALKLALSTLNEVRSETFRLMRNGQTLYAEKKVWDTITAIKEALAQPEQKQCDNCGEFGECCQAQSEQEPVAWKLVPVEPTKEMLKAMDECSTEGYDERLYAGHAASVYMAAVDVAPTPPQRKPLSDKQIILIVAECASSHQHTDIHFARAIEQAHGIKGEA